MSIERLIKVMQRLRDPETGCAWDIEQSFETIAPYTIEEAYEVADAIQRADLDDLRDELGDLLLQVAFDFDDVVTSIVDKMIRRHPHVFGDKSFSTTAEVKASWEAEKARERAQKKARSGATDNQPASALDGIALSLPALKRADKIQKRAARVGFDWPDAEPIYAKLTEETDEVKQAVENGSDAHIEEELGDLLFTAVNLTRHYGVDAETALMKANEKFSNRYRIVERLAAEKEASMTDMALSELDALWDQAKRDGNA